MPNETTALRGEDPLKRVACSKCGYPLRGLDVEGDCPECGQSIYISRTQSLVNASPFWLTQVCTGLQLLGWSFLALAGVMCCLIVGVALNQGAVNVGGSLGVVFVVVMLVVMLALLITLWRGTVDLATEPPPDTRLGSSSLRKNLRTSFGWAVLGGFVCAPISWFCWPWYFYTLGDYAGALGKQAGRPKVGDRIKWAGYAAGTGYICYTLVSFGAVALPMFAVYGVLGLTLFVLIAGLICLGVMLLQLHRQVRDVFLWYEGFEDPSR